MAQSKVTARDSTRQQPVNDGHAQRRHRQKTYSDGSRMRPSLKKRILYYSEIRLGVLSVPFWINALARATRQSRLGGHVAAAERLLRRILRQELGSSTFPTAFVPPDFAVPDVVAPDPASTEAVAKADPDDELPTAPKSRRPAFSRQVFEFEGERYGFNLYVPPLMPSSGASVSVPLVVMLHGCKQDAPDFARGTSMNELAAKAPCMVLYPEQLQKANAMRCWNWFDSAHQGQHAGEPAMLAALTRQVIARYPVDPTRVYITGLSAGGAMAAIVAAHNPDVFAAVGVHSGLPPGAAHDVMSAFSAMRSGGRSRTPGDPAALKDVMPTIVFHGDADRTVHPDNGDQIVLAAIAALKASGVALKRSVIPEELPAPTGEMRHALRTVYSTENQRHFVEYWSVKAGPHAWSGGNTAGSYTDPHGPDASAAMLAFFLQHHR
jgi:poly(hydroxyalkanoate) depolymerase family esterase